MSESRFLRTPGGVCPVLWSPSSFVASVGYVSESTVRRLIEHRWDAVAA
jgi:REP element-mobilizing transposase RayT